jgi:hypothetical protein
MLGALVRDMIDRMYTIGDSPVDMKMMLNWVSRARNGGLSEIWVFFIAAIIER